MSRAKRQRQKENTRQAREEREAAQKRRKRKSTAIRVVITVAAAAVAILGFNLIFGDDDGDDIAATDTSTTVDPTATTTTTPAALSEPDFPLDPAIDYSAKITTSKGEIVVDLDESTPVGAGHFVKLAKEGFYDGLTWHRAAKDFVIQGGDPNGDGRGGSGSSVVAEVPTDNYPVGSLAAAKTGTDPPGTFDAQFYVVTGSGGATLPNEYARFGSVTSGIEVAQAIEALAPETGDGPPTETVTIDKIEIVETPKPTDVTTAPETTVAP